jgi:hypothetical protein
MYGLMHEDDYDPSDRSGYWMYLPH